MRVGRGGGGVSFITISFMRIGVLCGSKSIREVVLTLSLWCSIKHWNKIVILVSWCSGFLKVLISYLGDGTMTLARKHGNAWVGYIYLKFHLLSYSVFSL